MFRVEHKKIAQKLQKSNSIIFIKKRTHFQLSKKISTRGGRDRERVFIESRVELYFIFRE